MTTKTGVGRSLARGSRAAGRAAALEARAAMGEDAADFCFVFATTGYDQAELFEGVAAVFGDTDCAGCSGEGIISGPCQVEDDFAVTVAAVRSSTLRFESLMLRDYDEDPSARGKALGRTAAELAPGDVVCLFVFSDGLRGNCTELLAGIESELSAPIPIVGGASADAMHFERTFQYAEGEVASNAVAAVLVTGQGRLEVEVSHGCSPIGLQLTITGADGGWVRSIDDQPAWDVFKSYLDGDPEDLNGEGIVHLCIGKGLGPEASDDYSPYVIRTPLRLDKQSGALFFPGGGMQVGDRIQLTRRDPDLIRAGARASAHAIRSRHPDEEPALVLQFDCAGRGKTLFGARSATEMLHPVQAAFGARAPWVGFLSYGEIAPILGRAYYHNYSAALCALYDGPGED